MHKITIHSEVVTLSTLYPPEGRYPCDLVIVPPLDHSSVHHVLDIGDGEGSLCNIGGHYAESHTFARGLKHLGGG